MAYITCRRKIQQVGAYFFGLHPLRQVPYGMIQFCQQLDVEPRLFFDALGAAAQYTGPLP